MKNYTKTKGIKILMVFAMLALWILPQQVQACDSSPAISFLASEDLGDGSYSIDIQTCMGNGGSEYGWTTSFTGLNVVSFSPASHTSASGNVATGSFAGNVLDYAYPGTGHPDVFVAQNALTCFIYTVVLDGDPVGTTLVFDGVNCNSSVCSGSCSVGGDDQTVAITNPIPPSPDCGETFFDSGGAGDYSNGENYTTVICPDIPGDPVSVTFTSFDTEAGVDFLVVYDGVDTGDPFLGSFAGTTIPGPFTSTHTSGCLTFTFASNGTGVAAGWEASVMCTTTSVPTLGQWGLILLALILLNLGLISILQSRYQLAGMPGGYFQNLPVIVNMVMEDKKGMGQQFVRSLLFIIALFAIAILFFGYTLMQFDIAGTILSAGLLAFLFQILNLQHN